MLTAKQQAFIVEYVKDYNPTRAAVAAGYSEKSAASTSSMLLAKPLVKMKIRELQEEDAQSSIISKAKVLMDCLEIAQNMKADPDDSRKATVALKALHQVAMLLGYYEEKEKAEQPVLNLQINVHQADNGNP